VFSCKELRARLQMRRLKLAPSIEPLKQPVFYCSATKRPRLKRCAPRLSARRRLLLPASVRGVARRVLSVGLERTDRRETKRKPHRGRSTQNGQTDQILVNCNRSPRIACKRFLSLRRRSTAVHAPQLPARNYRSRSKPARRYGGSPEHAKHAALLVCTWRSRVLHRRLLLLAPCHAGDESQLPSGARLFA
jgi:hypothetical protein